MAAHHSIILLEFNELTPSLMTRFMSEDKLPNFQRLYQESHSYITDAEEKGLNLNPWVQWVTVHTGLPFSEHKVFYLADGHSLKEKCIWDMVSDANQRVWVCGSMNIRYDAPINGVVLPDPWSSGVKPHPDELEPYYRFVQQHVQEYTNPDMSMSLADNAQFIRFIMSHGLSPATVLAILKQLLHERGTQSDWKRAVLLDKLQWDVFRWYYNKLNPQLATFFLNSTAHFQHKYWRNMEPDRFKIAPTPEEQSEYEKAILFGYQEMDRIVGQALELADPKTTIIFCTALSQQACLVYEDEGGKCFYRPKDFDQLLAFAGVEKPYTVSPVMSEEFTIEVESEEKAEVVARKLKALRVSGESVMLVEGKPNAVYSGCSIHRQVSREAMLSLEGSNRSIPFFEMFYQGEGIKSGMHHPDGLLWIRTPERKHSVQEEKVSLCSIAPTVLKILGVRQPETLRGESLV